MPETSSPVRVGSLRALTSFVIALFAIFVLTSYVMDDRERFPYEQPSLPIDQRVNDLMSRMTLDEKIGQMALIDKNSVEQVSHVRRYNIGALLSGGGAKPDTNTAEGWRDMISEYRDAALDTRLHIPLLYGVDANHGQGNVPGAVLFPHFIGLGATGNPDLVRDVAAATADSSEVIGALWNYSPTLDLPRDIRWGRVYEAFSDDPVRAGELGAAYIEGLQGTSSRMRVAASAKHYLGAGDMIWGSSSNRNFEIDQGLTPINEKKLREEYLPPFKKAVEAHVASVMVGLNQWGETKVSASTYLITDVLKGELGFKGVVVSDWYGVYEISPDPYESTVTAINAGLDMVMLPFDYKGFSNNVRSAVEQGHILPERIDDAVRRILTLKFALGLFDGREFASYDRMDNVQYRTLAREAVAQSLVLLKDDSVLPLSQNISKIRVAGSAADNVGIQSGAWTIEWQGVDGNWMPGGTSILEGIRDAAGAIPIEYSVDGTFQDDEIAEIGLVIVGEKPYAEGWGDTSNPTLSDEDLSAIERMKLSADKVVVIIVSGRPLIITQHIDSWDTVIAAWLPGSEGAGIADIIFGKVPFTGTLPLPWPRSTSQLPLTSEGLGVDGTEPLYPRGFGL